MKTEQHSSSGTLSVIRDDGITECVTPDNVDSCTVALPSWDIAFLKSAEAKSAYADLKVE